MKTNRTLLITLFAFTLIAAPATARAAESYELDPVHSMVMFKVKHLGVAYTHGMFRKVTGSYVIDEKKPQNSSVSIEVDAASVFTANKKRDDHLKSPDFLNVKQYPKITFKSTKVTKAGKGAKVTGTLSLHGKTTPVTVKMAWIGKGKDPWGKFRSGFEGTFTIKRSEFGMTKMPGAVGDEIHLTVAVEGIRK